MLCIYLFIIVVKIVVIIVVIIVVYLVIKWKLDAKRYKQIKLLLDLKTPDNYDKFDFESDYTKSIKDQIFAEKSTPILIPTAIKAKNGKTPYLNEEDLNKLRKLKPTQQDGESDDDTKNKFNAEFFNKKMITFQKIIQESLMNANISVNKKMNKNMKKQQKDKQKDEQKYDKTQQSITKKQNIGKKKMKKHKNISTDFSELDNEIQQELILIPLVPNKKTKFTPKSKALEIANYLKMGREELQITKIDHIRLLQLYYQQNYPMIGPAMFERQFYLRLNINSLQEFKRLTTKLVPASPKNQKKNDKTKMRKIPNQWEFVDYSKVIENFLYKETMKAKDKRNYLITKSELLNVQLETLVILAASIGIPKLVVTKGKDKFSFVLFNCCQNCCENCCLHCFFRNKSDTTKGCLVTILRNFWISYACFRPLISGIAKKVKAERFIAHKISKNEEYDLNSDEFKNFKSKCQFRDRGMRQMTQIWSNICGALVTTPYIGRTLAGGKDVYGGPIHVDYINTGYCCEDVDKLLHKYMPKISIPQYAFQKKNKNVPDIVDLRFRDNTNYQEMLNYNMVVPVKIMKWCPQDVDENDYYNHKVTPFITLQDYNKNFQHEWKKYLRLRKIQSKDDIKMAILKKAIQPHWKPYWKAKKKKLNDNNNQKKNMKPIDLTEEEDKKKPENNKKRKADTKKQLQCQPPLKKQKLQYQPPQIKQPISFMALTSTSEDSSLSQFEQQEQQRIVKFKKETKEDKRKDKQEKDQENNNDNKEEKDQENNNDNKEEEDQENNNKQNNDDDDSDFEPILKIPGENDQNKKNNNDDDEEEDSNENEEEDEDSNEEEDSDENEEENQKKNNNNKKPKNDKITKITTTN